MGKDQEQGSSPKAEAILAGALQEFLANGYAGTSMDRITAAAGVSKSTLYAYFKDKEALFSALIEQFVQKRLLPVFRFQALEVQTHDPDIVLRQLAERMIERVSQNPEIITFMRLLIFESGRFPHLGKTFVNVVHRVSFETLSRYLGSCPSLHLADPEATARIFMGALVYFIMIQEGLRGKEIIPMDSERIVSTLVQMILLAGQPAEG